MNILISVLGGGVWQDDEGCWRTCDSNAPYGARGVRFGRWRVEAAAQLYRARAGYQDRLGDKTHILAHGRGLRPDEPSNAGVVRNELIALRVPSEAIHLDPRSHNTYSALSAASRIAESLRSDVLWIVSNDWHFPRVRAMLECLPDLRDLWNREPQLLSCESVLLGNDGAQWKPIIETARASESFTRVLAHETRGVEDLRAGRYRLNVA